MRSRPVLAVVLAAASALVPATAAAERPFPPVIELPDGFQPEGIAVGRGSTFFAGSLATGAVVRGDLRTGEYDTLVESAAGPAVGIEVDARNRVWVAGGPSGQVRVYDGDTGAELGVFAVGAGFINDLVVTRDAVYATNSAAGWLGVVPLGPGGALPDPSAVSQLPLSGEWLQVPGFNANGIEAWTDGRLIVAHSALRALFAVDPATGSATRIDLGADLPFVDGITRLGHVLYAVQNRANQIAVVDLAADLATGAVTDVITDPDFAVPTTVAVFGDALYAVNAKFGIPTSDFEVVRAERT